MPSRATIATPAGVEALLAGGRIAVILSPMRCPCGLPRHFDRCCGPFLEGRADPPTAEALMRSRYVAYARGDIAYIARTTAPERPFDAEAARAWSAGARFLALRILGTDRGGAGDDAGTVEFVATYRQSGDTVAHREHSRFRRTDGGEWRFVDGDATSCKVGRNEPCICGSGKTFRKCCGATAGG